MKNKLMSAVMLIGLAAGAQDTIAVIEETQPTNPFTVSGYVEGYYSYDFSQPGNNTRPGFLYNFNRHNEFNVNLAFVRGTYSGDRLRANLAVGVGTYMNANYAAEPGVLKNVFEANAGYKLSPAKNVWFDIGIMPSHIGFESAIGKDNWALTRSLVAENTPYFNSGARLSYGSADGKLAISALALNGWQRITRVEGASLMSFGTQIYFKPSDKIALNYSTFFGTDKPDDDRKWRYYHNVYGIFQFTPVIGLTAGFDFGQEQKVKNNSDKFNLLTPVGILRITPGDKWAFALRGEYYRDEDGIIIATGTPNGFKTTGFSGNIDYMPVKNAVLRLELRNLSSKDAIFTDKDGNTTKTNTALTFSTAVTF